VNRKRSRRSKQSRDEAPRSWRLPTLSISKRAAAGALSGAALFLVVVIAAPPLWVWIKAHPYFVLTSVEVEGNLRTSDEEVVRLADIRPGQSLWDVSARSVAFRTETHPWIHKAEVRIEASGRVVIQVRERKPIAIVRFDELHYVDRRGHVLGTLNPEDSRNFPMITGLEKGAERAFAPVALPRTAQLLRWCERRGTIDELSEVHVDREAGITMFPADVSVAVELGWGRWREKLSRSARVFAAWQGRLDRLAAVDVSLPDTVIVRMRDGDGTTERQTKKSGRRI
jgi:cell division protein FtsQ